MREGVSAETANAHENQLRDVYWKDMIDEGAQVMRIRREYSSAWGAVNAILTRHKGGSNHFTVMTIQKELIDLQKVLPDSEAGRSLRASHEKKLEQQKQKMKQPVEPTGARKESLEQQRQREEIQGTLNEIATLNISVSRRILSFFAV
ncbi:hypothetical protein D9619_009057 [Psilocybe cf. subviscida]|uniref:Uncharacterized protein n=1 Tax=Psilocybe cf. subviscida TaxID=2480587 RepID=A0A8H5BUI4_9AGAR|nr:hypothetical protein D9619_009057 [Psilocybe cf. subviscida]